MSIIEFGEWDKEAETCWLKIPRYFKWKTSGLYTYVPILTKDRGIIRAIWDRTVDEDMWELSLKSIRNLTHVQITQEVKEVIV